MTFNRISLITLLGATVACATPSLHSQVAPPAGPWPSPVGARPSAALTSREKGIAAEVDRGERQALELLERIVNINSGTMNFAGVRRVSDVLRLELDRLGFETTWVDGAPFGRAGHLVAERTGKGPRILLIGHLDTVFEPGSSFQRLERSSDTTEPHVG